jgi:hypothetical protein
MIYWADLYSADDKETLEAGANMILQIALKLLNKKARPNTMLVIREDSEDNQQN